MQVRRDVLGDEYVTNSFARATDFSRPFQELVTEYCWGAVWTRNGLDLRTRSLLNIAMLCGLRQWSELELHLHGALTNGCSALEIQEALLQVTIYCGVPAGLEGFRIASKVLRDHGVDLDDLEGFEAAAAAR